jgi:hypothetical protein
LAGKRPGAVRQSDPISVDGPRHAEHGRGRSFSVGCGEFAFEQFRKIDDLVVEQRLDSDKRAVAAAEREPRLRPADIGD